jgi:hypothetical protein
MKIRYFGVRWGAIAVLLSGCAGGPLAERLQNALAPDPRLVASPAPEETPTPVPSPSPNPSPTTGSTLPVAPTPTPSPATSPETGTGTGTGTAAMDLDGAIAAAPEPLRPYLKDWAALGTLAIAEGANGQTALGFDPNRPISRRTFARWLLVAHNRLYESRPAEALRQARPNATAIFKDVPTGDRDFATIQGLAEAGILPSPLAGAGGPTEFRPDAPLTRETLLTWKVPLDWRQNLPIATVDTIQKSWGFQDAAKIDPSALRAIAADHQNGELSNVRRAFGFTTLLQPKAAVTHAEAAAALWYFGLENQGISAQDALAAPQEPTQVN